MCIPEGDVMKKLDKPVYLFKLVNVIIIVVGFLLTLISFLIPSDIIIFKDGIRLNIIICVIIFIIVFIIFTICYLLNIKKFYSEYENQFKEYEKIKNNNDALIKQFKDKQNEVLFLNNKLEQYDFVLNNIIYNISNGICDISIKENDFLKRLYSTVLYNKSYLLNKKGEDNDE